MIKNITPQSPVATTNGVGAMSPFEISAANRLVLLGTCPIEDLLIFTTVSL
jgi:hypothetical protein